MSEENEAESENMVQKDQGMDMSAFMPLASLIADQFGAQVQKTLEIQKDTLEFNKERLKVESSAFNRKYWLLSLVAVSIISISAGLIFWKNEITTGLSVLSHVGAVVVGIIAGSGWERIRTK